MSTRFDLGLLQRWVRPGARVLDLGCGDGALLMELQKSNRVSGLGVEIDPDNVNACLAAGLQVIEQDIDKGLDNFEDRSFDTVVMTYALQQVHSPLRALEEMLRIGGEVIVSFPNFAHWHCRLQLFFSGGMPVAPELPAKWYETQNIHLYTVSDFEQLCRDQGITIRERAFQGGRFLPHRLANLFAQSAIYRLSR